MSEKQISLSLEDLQWLYDEVSFVRDTADDSERADRGYEVLKFLGGHIAELREALNDPVSGGGEADE